MLTVKIPLIRNTAAQGDLTVGLELALPVQTVLLSPSQAVLTIRDVDQGPGQFNFDAAGYSFSESAGSGLITVLRTNGSQGIVTVAFATVAGTALPGSRYVSTNGVMTAASAFP
jgi:hypothetical protein